MPIIQLSMSTFNVVIEPTPKVTEQVRRNYVALGKQINDVFKWNLSNENIYDVECVYEGYLTPDLKCGPNGENSYFVLTNNETGETQRVEFSSILDYNIYDYDTLVMIHLDLVRLALFENKLFSYLDNANLRTAVYYGRKLFVLQEAVRRLIVQCQATQV